MIDWFEVARQHLDSAERVISDKDLRDDEAAEELTIYVGSTILYSLVSLANSMKRIADHFDPPLVAMPNPKPTREELLATNDEGVFG